jgi:hypothetical protein
VGLRTPLILFVALLVISVSGPAIAAAHGDPCRIKAAELKPRTIAGLRIDRTERRGQNWLRYTGRFRDTYFIVETGACERYVRQLIVISPEGTDPWSRLESLRRLFGLPPAPLSVEQRSELRQKGRLALTYDKVQMTYDYRAVGIVSIISLGFADRP